MRPLPACDLCLEPSRRRWLCPVLCRRWCRLWAQLLRRGAGAVRRSLRGIFVVVEWCFATDCRQPFCPDVPATESSWGLVCHFAQDGKWWWQIVLHCGRRMTRLSVCPSIREADRHRLRRLWSTANSRYIIISHRHRHQRHHVTFSKNIYSHSNNTYYLSKVIEPSLSPTYFHSTWSCPSQWGRCWHRRRAVEAAVGGPRQTVVHERTDRHQTPSARPGPHRHRRRSSWSTCRQVWSARWRCRWR